MKKNKCIFLFSICFTLGQAQIMWQFNNDSLITWNYEWGDEFNEKEMDRTKWSFGAGGSRTIFNNKEQQYYTDGSNHVLENGVYKIIARKEKINARCIDWMGDNDSLWNGKKFMHLNKKNFEYTSEKIESRRLFTKGFFEIRFKAPSDKGMWPAFWLAGGDPNEEIDIFELKGEKPTQTHVAVHCPNNCEVFKNWYGKKIRWGGWLPLREKLSDGFNVMAGEWGENGIKFYVNGECIAFVPVKFNVPKLLIANMAIPSNEGPFHPGPEKDMNQSTPFEIDYIRVWTMGEGNKGRGSSNQNTLAVSSQGLKAGKALAGKKNSFMYGKKSIHANEGPIVSLMNGGVGKYMLYCLGLKKEAKISIHLLDSAGKDVFAQERSDYESELDFSNMKAGTYELTLKYGNKTASYPVTLK